MKKFTKWLAVCAACLALGAVPAAGATTSVQPTVAQASVKTTKPAPKPRRGWYGTMPKKCYYGKDGQTLKGDCIRSKENITISVRSKAT